MKYFANFEDKKSLLSLAFFRRLASIIILLNSFHAYFSHYQLIFLKKMVSFNISVKLEIQNSF